MADEKKANDAGGSVPPAVAGELKKVTLKTDHQHAGERHKAGDEIEVNAADEKWLRDNKVI